MTDWMSQVQSPTLVLATDRVRANIRSMAERARRAGVVLRPHFKTHQSDSLGEWFREAGIDRIAVSSVNMAGYFMDAGWRDVLIAMPVNLREIPRMKEMSPRGRLGVCVQSMEVWKQLAGADHLETWIEVDTGYGRTGIHWQDESRLVALAQAMGDRFQGLVSHPGHSYAARGTAAIMAIHEMESARLQHLRSVLTAAGCTPFRISSGDTPTCSVAETFPGRDEIRPGNFAFYDVMQEQIGACTAEEIGTALAAPVIAVFPERGEITVHGGAVHLSKERLSREDGGDHYGLVAWPDAETGWSKPIPGAFVHRLSQEHGTIRASREVIERVAVGDLLMILPVHSCLTADLMGSYLETKGKWHDTMRGKVI